LEAEVAVKEGLHVEQMLSADQIKALTKTDHFHRCLNTAVRYLSYRPRSEAELEERLRQRGFDNDTQGAVRTKLKEQGLVDDMAFAELWKENRESFSPRSRWLTSLELRQKGIASDIIEHVVNSINDEDSAYRAALSKVGRLSRADYESFHRRLGQYLKRRGFSYGVINHTVEQLWQDQGSAS